MATSTTYDVRLRYMMEDRASRGLKSMKGNLDRTAKSSGLLSRGLKAAAASAVAFFGARAAGKALIGFNSNLEQARINMAGMLKLNIGGTMEANFAKANQLVGDLQQRAKASVGTTKDFVDTAAMLVRPFAAASIPVERMGELTQGVIIASKAFGVQADVAARDVEAALMGNVRAVDRFSRSLGLVPAEFNKLSASARAMKLEEALTQPAIAQMAAAQEKSFEGVLSTLEDAFQIFAGKVGLPLFKAITTEITNWNKWLDRNGDVMDRIGKEFSESLMTGFNAAKSIMSFFVEHKDSLMLLAKMWIGAKLIGGGARMITGGIQGIQGAMAAMSQFAQAGPGAISGLKGLTAAIGPLSLAVAGVAAVMHEFIGDLEKSASERTRKSIEFGSTGSQAARLTRKAFQARENFDYDAAADFAQRAGGFLSQQGLLTETGQLRGGQLAQQLENTTAQVKQQLARDLQIQGFNKSIPEEQQAALIAEAFRKMFENIQSRVAADAFLPSAVETKDAIATESKKAPGKGRDKINVTIQRIEVQSDDPDRFTFALTQTIADTVRNGGSIADALPEAAGS